MRRKGKLLWYLSEWNEGMVMDLYSNEFFYLNNTSGKQIKKALENKAKLDSFLFDITESKRCTRVKYIEVIND